MMQLAIEEPKIEQFFNNSKTEIINALKFLVDNNIKDFNVNTKDLELNKNQEIELESRIASFYKDRSQGRSFEEIEQELVR